MRNVQRMVVELAKTSQRDSSGMEKFASCCRSALENIASVEKDDIHVELKNVFFFCLDRLVGLCTDQQEPPKTFKAIAQTISVEHMSIDITHIVQDGHGKRPSGT